MKRIKRILNQPHNRSHIMEKFTATGLLLAVVTALSFGSNKFLNPQSPTERQNSVLENVQTTPSVPEQNSVLSAAFDATSSLVSSISDAFGNDTLPKRRGKVTIQTDDENGKPVKLKADNGQITELEVDGKPIPKEDFEKYRDLTDDILSNVPAPPMSPTAPMPPVPPMPPAGNWHVPTPPTPPTPPTGTWHFPVPPTPPVPPIYLKKSKDVQGNTLIKMRKRDGKESEIKITLDKEVFIDGKKVEEGADIALELGDTEGYDFQVFAPNSNYHYFGNGGGFTIINDEDSSKIIKINPKIKKRIKLKNEDSNPFYFNNSDGFAFHYDTEQWRRRADSFSREARKMVQLYRIDADKLRRDAQRLSRERFPYSTRAWGENNWSSQKDVLEDALKKDGFLKQGEKKYKIELTNKKLKINGKEMPKEMHERYLKLIGQNPNSKFSIMMEEDL